MLGVYRTSLLRVYAEALVSIGTVDHALIVHCGGLDELAPIGPAEVAEVRRREAPAPGENHFECLYYRVDPADWGVPRCTVADLAGGGPAENAAILRAVLAGGEGRATSMDALGHVGRTIALNAGAALYVAGLAGTLQEGYATALAALCRGSGLEKLDLWVAATRAIAAARDEHQPS